MTSTIDAQIIQQFEREREEHIQKNVNEFKEFFDILCKTYALDPTCHFEATVQYKRKNLVKFRIYRTLDGQFSLSGEISEKKNYPFKEKLNELTKKFSTTNEDSQQIFEYQEFDDIGFLKEIICDYFELSQRDLRYDISIRSGISFIHGEIGLHQVINRKWDFVLYSDTVTWELEQCIEICDKVSIPFTGEELLLLEDKTNYILTKIPKSFELGTELLVYKNILSRIFATESIYVNLIAPAQDKMYTCPW